MAPGAPITPILGAIQGFKQKMTDGEFMLGLTIIMNDLRITVRLARAHGPHPSPRRGQRREAAHWR